MDEIKWKDVSVLDTFHHPTFGACRIIRKRPSSATVEVDGGKTTLIMKDVILRAMNER